MAEQTADETAVTPGEDHGEEIHMPPNSYWPLVTSIGVAATLVGLIPILDNPIGFIVGLVILLVGIGGWVRDARKEYKELH